MQSRLDGRQELRVPGRLALEDSAPSHVHMGRAPLEVQERAVEARQAIRVGHEANSCIPGKAGSGLRQMDECESNHTFSAHCLPSSLESIRSAESLLLGVGASGEPIGGREVFRPPRGESAAWSSDQSAVVVARRQQDRRQVASPTANP